MPFDVSNVPKRLIKAVRKQRVVPFIGAGLSAQTDHPFPNWSTLLKSLNAYALENNRLSEQDSRDVDDLISSDRHLAAAEELKQHLPQDEYETFLEEQFNPPGVLPAEVHSEIFGLRPSLILTTNYDRLIEDAYASMYRKTPFVRTYRDAPLVQKYFQDDNTSEPMIFKLHGSIENPESVILSERDYRELIHRSPGYRLVLSAVFVTRVVLFLGFSFGDPELRLLLENHRESLKDRGHPDFIFLSSERCSEVERRRLRQDFGVECIPYTPSKGHPEVLEFLKYLVDQLTNSK